MTLTSALAHNEVNGDQLECAMTTKSKVKLRAKELELTKDDKTIKYTKVRSPPL